MSVQLGVLAACIVLFVPMGMAGWHLSRNKMLFFSCALFITLAVGVHLTPYFPSISNLVSSIAALKDRDSCISFLHNVIWDFKSSNLGDEIVSWRWGESEQVAPCEFQKLGRYDASDLLNGSWVVVAGDSQARLIALSLLNLVLDSQAMDSVKSDLFKRHSDYQITVDEIGMKLDFIWAPYVWNLTDLFLRFKEERVYPDVLVMGSGLWHMLHVTDASDYGHSVRLLKNSVLSFLPVSPELGNDGPMTGSVSIGSPHLFWLGMPMLLNAILNTEEKREKMTDKMLAAYEREIYDCKLWRQSGGPFLLLDIHSLSQKCGARCTDDGMHYYAVVYEAAIQLLTLKAIMHFSYSLLSFSQGSLMKAHITVPHINRGDFTEFDGDGYDVDFRGKLKFADGATSVAYQLAVYFLQDFASLSVVFKYGYQSFLAACWVSFGGAIAFNGLVALYSLALGSFSDASLIDTI
ncbi:hypothetical protein RJ641_025251 [Dillenia turbinata]|uniref:Uncharacterized protein n=1 Tax=Dillenia turbinata TaxID=194707 RepID=A0AAN8W6J7_9MAGN